MSPLKILIGAFAVSLVSATVYSAVAKADIASPESRHETVALASGLSKVGKPVPVTEGLKSPFNPAGFDRPDSEEQKVLAATVEKIQGDIKKIRSPREIIEAVAPSIQPESTVIVRGAAILYWKKKAYKIGDIFTIENEGSSYQVTLSAIDRTTFTLRYRNEEITRPIKSAKN